MALQPAKRPQLFSRCSPKVLRGWREAFGWHVGWFGGHLLSSLHLTQGASKICDHFRESHFEGIPFGAKHFRSCAFRGSPRKIGAEPRSWPSRSIRLLSWSLESSCLIG